MSVTLTETERAQLRRIVKRPRSRKQAYRARALLALDEGHPLETVARMFKVGPEKVASWAAGFAKLRVNYLKETPGPGPKTRWNGPDDPDDEDAGLAGRPGGEIPPLP